MDDGLAAIDYPDARFTYGAWSGSVHIENNTITFANSLAYIHNYYSDVTVVTMLGGDRWSTGGSISETQAPAGYAIEGLQLSFGFQRAAIDTPINSLLSTQTFLTSSLYW